MFIGLANDLHKQAQQDPIAFFSCNPKWPLCRFNFTKPHVIPDEFVFKVEKWVEVEIFQDYFSPNKFLNRMQRKPPPTSQKDILIERNYHYCKVNLFTETLATLYSSPDV